MIDPTAIADEAAARAGSMIDNVTRGIFDDLENGTAFNRELEQRASQVRSRVNDIVGSLPDVSSLRNIPTSIINNLNGIEARITSTLGNMDGFAEHITNQFDNLGDNLNLFSSAQRLENELAASGGSSGGGRCGQLHDFFGSITQEGPELLQQLRGRADSMISEVGGFTSAYNDLRTQITGAQSALQTQIQAEIGAITDQTKIAQLQGLLTTIQSDFDDGLPDIRSGLMDQARALVSPARANILQQVQQQMSSVDQIIGTRAGTISNLMTEIEGAGGLLGERTTNEQSLIDGAVRRLTTLAQASGIRSLFSTDQCVQTLLGYVGTDQFIGRLRGFI